MRRAFALALLLALASAILPAHPHQSNRDALSGNLLPAALAQEEIEKPALADLWQTESIAGEPDVSGCCLAYNKDGKPAISYIDLGKGYMKFARWDGREWRIEMIDRAYSQHGYDLVITRLVFDAEGCPYIAYLSPSSVSARTLKVARNTGKQWTIEDIAYDIYGDVSLVTDSDGKPAMAFTERFAIGEPVDEDVVRFARCIGNDWRLEKVDRGTDPLLAFSQEGYPVISYTKDENPWLAEWRQGEWRTRALQLDFVPSALAVTREGQLSVVGVLAGGVDEDGNYEDYAEHLVYALQQGGEWEQSIVASAQNDGPYFEGPYTLTYDSFNRPLLCFGKYEGCEGEPCGVHLAKSDGSSWSSEIVGPGWACCGSVAIAKGRIAGVAYADFRNGVVKYAISTDSGWKSEIVDGGGFVAEALSLALDSKGNPAVAYSNSTLGRTEFTWWDGTKWKKEAIDEENECWTISLAFDSSDQPVAGYLVEEWGKVEEQNTEGESYFRYVLKGLHLRFAQKIDERWSSEEVSNITLPEGASANSGEMTIMLRGQHAVAAASVIQTIQDGKPRSLLSISRMVGDEVAETSDVDGWASIVSSESDDFTVASLVDLDSDSYAESLDLYQWDGGTWHSNRIQLPEETPIFEARVSLDTANRVHLFYPEHAGENAVFQYWTQDNGLWKAQLVSRREEYTHTLGPLVIGPSGEPATCFVEEDRVYFAFLSDLGWQVEVVGDTYCRAYQPIPIALVFDKHGYLTIAYQEYGNEYQFYIGNMKVFRRTLAFDAGEAGHHF